MARPRKPMTAGQALSATHVPVRTCRACREPFPLRPDQTEGFRCAACRSDRTRPDPTASPAMADGYYTDEEDALLRAVRAWRSGKRRTPSVVEILHILKGMGYERRTT